MTPDEKALLDEINRAIGRIEGRLQTFIEEHKNAHKAINDRLDNLENSDASVMRWEGARQLAVWLLGSVGMVSLIVLEILILIRG
jgi:hypothetical protein